MRRRPRFSDLTPEEQQDVIQAASDPMAILDLHEQAKTTRNDATQALIEIKRLNEQLESLKAAHIKLAHYVIEELAAEVKKLKR
jgi:hypothetical protein